MTGQSKILTGQRTATKEEIRSVAEEVAKKFNPEKIILFGSYAWEQPDLEENPRVRLVEKTRGQACV